MPPPTPTVRNFMTADQVFQQASGKWCVIGIFQRILSPRFPALHASLGLYVEVADAQGEYDIRIDFCNSMDQVLSPLRGIHLSCKDRLSPAGFGIQTYNLPLPAPGRYFFKLYFNDELIAKDIAVDAVPLESPK